MNAQPASASPHDVAANPPAGLRVDTIAIADLVFGYSSTDGSDSTRPRPLALLPNAALELDLTDPEQREFGDYELLELIGEGGMGVVYRAYQKTLDREVAVKLLAAGPWASKPYVERFRREAQNAARMQHPNIVAIYEVASAEELHFFSMRLVRGPSLAVVLKRDGPLPPRKAASLMRTIAEAVDYAHRLGVLHLDLKPGNVLIDETGTAHVADFGLARRLDPIDGTGIEADAEEISGTPSYMAPEQANMQKLSPAADVWGLGAVLYELLTGRPPFLGDTPKDTLRLVRETRPAPPRQLAPAAPRDLEAITLACLQHDPAQRYPSARELADDLGRFIEGRAVKARPLNAAQRSLRWARREPRLALATLLAFLALGVGMLATTQQWQRADANAQLAAQNAALVSERLWQTRIDQAETALRAGHAFNALPSLAANIAEREHEGKDASVDRLRYANVLRSAPQLIDAIGTNAPLTHAALSDDGRFVATTTSTGLKGSVQLYELATGVRRWETDTFDSRRPENSVTPRNLHFTADRRFLIVSTEWLAAVAVQPSGVAEYLLDAGTGQILQPPQDRYPNLDYATYSPDAEYALVHTLNGRQAQILRSSDWTVVSPLVPLKGFDPNWLVAPHGAHVAATRNGFTDLVLLDPRTLRERQHFAAPETQRLTAWAFSPDARELLIGRSNGSLERIAMADGKRTAVVPAPLGRIGRVAYSADGRWFGAVAESGEVMVWEATGATLVAPVARFEGLPPDFGGYRLELDPASRLVLAARGSHNGLWRLIARDQPPKQLASELPGGHSITLDAKRGILAGGRLPASLYLWRLQPEAMRASSLAPLQQKEFPAADRIAGVDGAAVQIVASRDGRAQGPRIALPQAPSFATLTADGARTVIVVGHELRVHDAQSGQPSITPLMLANDPQHVVIAPDSRHLFASYGDYADSRYVEIAQSFDLVSGKALSAPTPLPGQIDDVFFSADGATVGVGRYDEIRLLNADTLTPRFPPKVLGQGANALLDHYYEHELDTVGPRNFDAPGLGHAAISADGRWLDVILNTNPDTGELLRLDAHSGEQIARASVGNAASSLATLPRGGGWAVQAADGGPLQVNPGRGARALDSSPLGGRHEGDVLALSADGQQLAHAIDNTVALADVQAARWLGPLLASSLSASDRIDAIAFSADGSSLVARSRRGRWLRWNVAKENRPAADLAREGALLGEESATPEPVSDAERSALRARDPGPPAIVDPATHAVIPPRQPGLPATLFDLSAYYNMTITDPDNRDEISVDIPAFAPGTRRLLGVDYDARGMIALDMPALKILRGQAPTRVAGIRPGVPKFAALDVLIGAIGRLKQRKREPYCYVELTYADASKARLPIVYRNDIWESWVNTGDAGTAHVAWSGSSGTPGGAPARLYAVRLANPYPQRSVASVAFESTDVEWSLPALLAITAETGTATSAATPSPPSNH